MLLAILLLSLNYGQMKAVNAIIDIGDYRFRYVQEVEIESTWELLTDGGSITIPRKLSFRGKSIAQGASLFKKGDPVKIQMGYDEVYDTVFTGYLSGIKPKLNLEFKIQDAMWLLKQKAVTQSYKKVTLSQLLTDISPIPFEAVDVNLGQFRISKATVAQVLEELRKAYGLYSWVRDGTLFAGLAYRAVGRQSVVFRFEHNIIEDELEYLRGDDVGIKVKAISMLPDNKKIEIEVGDTEGDQRTLHFYNLSEKELKATAEREIERLKYEGYRGSFLSFGQPHVRHGDIAIIQDNKFPDKAGSYLIKKVTYSIGVNGYRQQIYLDKKVS